MTEISLPQPLPGAVHHRAERVRALCRRHWLGYEETPEIQSAAAAVRRGYSVTASEHFKAATRMYETLTSPQRQSSPTAPPAVSYVNRNVQLLLAYSALWEAFRHIYNAACYTEFARNGAERDAVETERTKMDRVLKAPILLETDVAKIVLLRDGETPGGAIKRLITRHSRELEQFEGEARDQTVTDMDAFRQGVVRAGSASQHAAEGIAEHQWDAWVVSPLDDDGNPLDPDSPHDAAKYRSVIKWLCYQIRQNINFVDKTDDSLDDMILVMRAFCLLEPIVGLLLLDTRKDAIFAL
jgi:hypothetical protein